MKQQFLACSLSIFLSYSCSHSQQQNKPEQTKIQNKSLPKNKPGSSYQDTLVINSSAAVFYDPDSVQLEKIRSVTDKGVFDANMHEYYFLTKTARNVIKNNKPSLKIIDAKNVRYLLFIKSDKSKVCIDLDTKFDPYGLLIFNKRSDPQQVDLSNIDTALGFYFTDK